MVGPLFFLEMDALTKSSCRHDEKIVRFSFSTLFLHVNSTFSERKTTNFPLFLCNRGDGRLAVPEDTNPPANPAQPPQDDVFGCGTSKNIILGRLGAGVSWGEEGSILGHRQPAAPRVAQIERNWLLFSLSRKSAIYV